MIYGLGVKLGPLTFRVVFLFSIFSNDSHVGLLRDKTGNRKYLPTPVAH